MLDDGTQSCSTTRPLLMNRSVVAPGCVQNGSPSWIDVTGFDPLILQDRGTGGTMDGRFVSGFAWGVVATFVMSGLMLLGVPTGMSPMPTPIPLCVHPDKAFHVAVDAALSRATDGSHSSPEFRVSIRDASSVPGIQ
jgi:hypothetical protein